MDFGAEPLARTLPDRSRYARVPRVFSDIDRHEHDERGDRGAAGRAFPNTAMACEPRPMRTSFLLAGVVALLVGCSSDDDVAFKPKPSTADAGSGGSPPASGAGASGGGGDAPGQGGSEATAGSSGQPSQGGGDSGQGGTDTGQGGNDTGQGGTDAGQGGTGGADPGMPATVCGYTAFAENTLAKIEERVANGLAEGYEIHALLGRSENNSGAAPPNVAWLLVGGQLKGYGNMEPAKLAATVSTQLEQGATIHTLIAREHGSSVPTEVSWSQKGNSLRAHESYDLDDLGDDVNDDADDGFGLVGLFARRGNNGGGIANVVWLKNADGYFSRSAFDVKKLASQVTTDVKDGAQVVRFLARAHSSSVATEVVWLEKEGVFEAHESYSLATQATTINGKLAAGYTVRALFAREGNNGGAVANVAWLAKGNTMKALADQSAPKLATLVTAELAAGWALHSVFARPTGSPVPPEVVWLAKPCAL